ncbi:ABC transporter permease [Reinekea blandensis]|uniref:Peptide ABC transporter, permease protein n=1 Tax=Reinekea blandensis MED297 TaxID=314283 RepID=A4BA58_9GAMM|nr:ABC transporter permease [Reinekea blandensis]EAR10814.1 peptide ABC transporter, permease protein [Reinekea sp. MED297] [Reinekea blandensis MED297]
MAFILRRLAFYIIAIFVAITFNFLIPRMMPGDPVDALFAAAGGRIPPEQLDAYKEMLGFVDGPLWVQYLQYLKSILTFDLGPTIMMFPVQVTELLQRTVPWTIALSGTATLISVVVGCFIGLYASYNRGGFVDRFYPVFWQFMASMPQAVTSLFIFFIFAMTLKWFPLGYGADPDLDPAFTWEYIRSILHHAVLPMVTLFVAMLATWIFTMRNAMVNVLGEDYITMAKAKGLSARRIMTHYAARNAILPVVTAVSMALGFAVAGQIFVETVFNYPGIGQMMFKSVGARDYPMMQACFLLLVLFVLAANFIADVLYVLLDPRLRK